MRHLPVQRRQGTPIATIKEVVLKRVRDLVVTLAVLVLLFAMLAAINPRVREHFHEMTAEMQGRQIESSFGSAASAAAAVGASYAGDNPFLLSFLVVAVVLFMAMLRT
jgi:hypothetical protein